MTRTKSYTEAYNKFSLLP